MNTVTVCAYNRPEYLKQVLDSLAVAQGLCCDFPFRLFIGVDPGGERFAEVLDVASEFMGTREHECLIVWPEHLGVSEHPRRLLQYVFTEVKSDFNLHLEDDTVLSPDALRICEWFQSRFNRDLLGLSSPNTGTPAANLMERVRNFRVWGWACGKVAWHCYVSPFWNHRRVLPIGWDYSMTDTMHKYSLQMICPQLSRVRNIGREGGVHSNPEIYDRELGGQVWARWNDAQRTEDFRL